MKAKVCYVTLTSFDALRKPKRANPIVDADEDNWSALLEAVWFCYYKNFQ